MPEQEFELYLSLLSRFLRLKPAQRDGIADELRDHLEERLEELARRGLSRSDAIRAALDEFGDAAELAQHFTNVAHARTRRMIMRVTFGTVAALTASLLIAIAFWPESPQSPAPQIAAAQALGRAGAPSLAKPAGKSVAAEDGDKAAVEEKLSKQIGKVEFQGIPLWEVLEFLGEQMEIDILIGNSTPEDSIDRDATVELTVKRAKLSGRAALDLVLEPLGLGYTIRDGLILVTTSAHANQIQVYNVRDLLRQFPEYGPQNAQSGLPLGGMGGGGGWGFGGMGGGMMTAMGMMQVADAETVPGADGEQFAQFSGGNAGAGAPAMPGMGGGFGGGMPPPMGGMGGFMGGREAQSLAQVIATTIDPESWDSNGGNGSIVQYHELLVVKNSQSVHGKIKALLEMMRASAREIPAQGAAQLQYAPPPGVGAPANLPANAPSDPVE